VLTNLVPDAATGALRIPLAQLGLRADPGCGDVHLTVAAVEGELVALTHAPLSLDGGSDGRVVPRRPLASPQPASTTSGDGAAFVPVQQQSRISVLGEPGASVQLSAAAAYTKVGVFGSLDRAAGLIAALAGASGRQDVSQALLGDWSFMTGWPALSPAARAAKYSRFASHEVSQRHSQQRAFVTTYFCSSTSSPSSTTPPSSRRWWRRAWRTSGAPPLWTAGCWGAPTIWPPTPPPPPLLASTPSKRRCWRPRPRPLAARPL
jgi:hypothetical protein